LLAAAAAAVMGSVAVEFLVVAAVHYSDLLLAGAAQILKLYNRISYFINPCTYHLISIYQNTHIK
jgi:hypothetical protein